MLDDARDQRGFGEPIRSVCAACIDDRCQVASRRTMRATLENIAQVFGVRTDQLA